MKKIILITSTFPYYPGEQFLETEIKYYDGIDITILPMGADGKCRDIPDNVKLDKYIINRKSSFSKKLFFLAKAFLNSMFYREFFTKVGIKYRRFKPFLASMYGYERFYNIFDNYLKNQNDLKNIVIYTYWNTEATYALQSLKKKYGYKLVSRIHRFDIYKERRLDSYMPLKHLFTENIDKVFTITESANKYLTKTYGFKSEKLELSRLGVDDNNIVCKPSDAGKFIIVSCSFLVNVKRIDKIIDALAILSKKLPLVKFVWNHIGSGPLESSLKEQAKAKLSNCDNVQYNFLGLLDNQEVYQFYKNNAVDVFVNVSESEGVPVSIMEAMSCHIPIVAPDVGGISDMIIDKTSGILLSEKCELNELADALSDIEFFKNEKTRDKAYEVYLEKYDAKKNYIEFIEKLKGL